MIALAGVISFRATRKGQILGRSFFTGELFQTYETFINQARGSDATAHT